MKSKTLFYIIIAVIIGIIGGVILNSQTKNSLQTVNKQTDISPSPLVPEGFILVKAYNTGFNPNTIRVKQGDSVKLRLVSNDSPHTFTIDELNVNKEFTFGKDADVVFTADKKGTFQFYCGVPGHKESGMIGTLIVE